MNPTYEAALRRIEAKAGQIIAAQALDFRNEPIEELSQAGTGAQYGPHRASAPGDPPAVNTGLLRQSVTAAQLSPLSWGVGLASVPYPDGGATTSEVGVFLEYGTRTILPRPFMRPALDRWKAKRKP